MSTQPLPIEPGRTAEETRLPVWIRIKFAVLRGFLSALARLLGLSGLYTVCTGFAWCEWLINFKRRRRFHARLRTLFGHQLDRRMARRACRSYFVRTRSDKVYYLIFDLIPKAEILRRVTFPKRAEIEQALDRGQGVYVAISHFGAHHIGGLLMCLLGFRIAGVRDPDEGPLRRHVQNLLAGRFSEVRAAKIFYSGTFPRDLYRWFKDNGILASTLDVAPSREPQLKRLAATVFGEPRSFLIGPLQIALRCGASIYQGFVISRSNFRYELTGSPLLLSADQAADDPDALQSIVDQYAANFEAALRTHPDHLSRI